MNIVQKEQCIFHIDVEETKRYYQQNTLCDCDTCRNLYAQIKTLSPRLTDFLAKFGIDVCRPDSVSSIDSDNGIDYISVGYTVVGNTGTDNPYETAIENYHIKISTGKRPEDYFPNEQTLPHFFLSVTGISLPWVLEDSFPRSKGLVDTIKHLFKKQP